MSEKNIDSQELLQAIDNLTELDEELIESITGLSDSNKAYILAAKAEKQEIESRKKLFKAIGGSIDDFIALGKTMTGSGSSFEPIKQSVNLVSKATQGLAKKAGGVGGLVASIIDATAKAATHVIDSFEKAYTSFEKISGTGIVTTFDEFAKMSLETSITMDQLGGLLEKRGKELAYWGDGAVKGAKAFTNLNKSLKLNRVDYQLLGITINELAESQLDYMNLERMTTKNQVQFDMTYKKGYQDYLDNLTTLSSLTGETRETLRKQMEARQQEITVRIFSQRRTAAQKIEDNKIMTLVGQLGPIYEKGFRDIYAARAAGVEAKTEEALAVRRAQSMGGEDISELAAKLLKGVIGVEEVNDRVLKAASKSVEIRGKSAALEQDSLDRRIQVEQSNAKTLSQKTTAVRIAEANAAKSKPPAEIDKRLANSRIQMNDLSINAEQLSSTSRMAAKSMNYLSKKMADSIGEMYKKSGKNVPEILKVTMEESELRDKLFDVNDKLQEQMQKNITAKKMLEDQSHPLNISDAQKERVKVEDSDKAIERLTKEAEELNKNAALLAQKRKTLENLRVANKNTSAVGASTSGTSSTTSADTNTTGGSPRTSNDSSNAPSSMPSGGSSRTPMGSSPEGLGSLSRQYESGSMGSMAVGVDSRGGTSYGKYQIASRVGAMADFLKMLDQINPEAANRLRNAGPADAGKNGRFAQEWRKLVGEGAIAGAETQFAFEKIYTPALQNISSPELRKMIEGDRALQEMLFSSSIQHGPAGAPAIFNKVYKNGMNKQDFVRGVYTERRSYLSKLTPGERQGVLNRYNREQTDVMSMLNTPPAARPTAPTASTPPIISQSSAPVLVSGPSTGHNVVMQGEQTVVPASAGTSATAAQSLLQQASSDEDNSTKVFLAMMNENFDNMIDLMNNKISIQRKMNQIA